MLSVVVQAGGDSSRMGENKALKPFLGRPLIERIVERLQPVADELLITANEIDEYRFLKIPLARDIQPGCGPISGLFTALSIARYNSVAVIACDLPFVCSPLLVAGAGFLFKEVADIVTAKTADGFEPLHAVYRRQTCLPAIEAAIASGQRQVIAWFPQVRVRRFTEEELARYDPEGVAFFNVNTPMEFAEAERLAGRDQMPAIRTTHSIPRTAAKPARA